MSLPERVDMLVVGAGTAGAAVSARAAARGLRVLCIDRRELDEAGARWVNGVSRGVFADAEVPAPEGAELRGAPTRFHLIAGRGPERVTVQGHDLLEVDMRHLVERLQRRAREAGADLAGGVSFEGFERGVAQTSAGRVAADVLVDASGLGGAKLLGPAPARADLCAASQGVYAIADHAGARAFLDSHGAGEDETVCFTGVAGGYSILNVRMHGDEVSLLTGSIPADGHTAGHALLEAFVNESPSIGDRVFGGQRAIPLGRPLDVLTRGRVAAIGDAARQVFSAHGSGIGAGMVAGKMLADAVVDTGGVEAYGARWMRRYGGLFAAYDAFRRFSQTLTAEDLSRLMAAGVLDAESAAAGIEQRWPRPSPRRAFSIVGQVARIGRLGARLAAVGAKMAALGAMYAAYPERGSVERWAARARRLSPEGAR